MNISERKLYDYIFSSMDEGLLVIDENGTIIDTNETLCKILGGNLNEFEDDIFGWLMNREELELMDAILNAVCSNGKTETNYIKYNNNGNSKILCVRSSYTMYDDGKKLIVIIYDATPLYSLINKEKSSKEIEKINAQLTKNNLLITKAMHRFVTEGVIKDALNLPAEKFRKPYSKEVTILISDLRGFTAICETLEAMKVFDLMDCYYRHMLDCISKYNGTVLEILGDGILAVFGAPNEDKDHAEKAIATAIEMQNQMENVNKWAIGNDCPQLMMGIGISTGQALIGNMGSDLRVRYNAVGKCIEQAEYLESHTVDGQIFVSDATEALVTAELKVKNRYEIKTERTGESVSFCSIEEIGYPYDVAVKKQKDITMSVLEKPVKIFLNRMLDKTILPENIGGKIIKISRKYAVLESDAELNIFDNIFCNITGDVYAKVTEIYDNSYRIDFTSYDERFDEWFDIVTGRKS